MFRTALFTSAGASLALIIASESALADTDEPTSSDTLAEVIVTAEKQVQSLQKTSAAVTAISAEDLIAQGVTQLREAPKLVPNVRFQVEGDNVQVIVRGIGSVLDFQNVEAAVAFNVAGSYAPREATSAAFFDIEKFEVLPGPQGTLYGRGALGGTINLTPTRPGFNNDGTALVELGNYSSIHGTVTQNFMASEQLAFRAAVDYAKDDGYMDTGSYARDDVSVRLSTIYNPSERLSMYFWAQGAEKNGYNPNLVNKGTDPQTFGYCEQCFLHDNPWNDTRSDQFATFGAPERQKSNYRSMTIAGQVDYDFDNATLSYIPSYLYLDTVPYYWLSAILAVNTAHYNQIAQELRLASTSEGPWKWLAGLYAFNSRNNGTFTLFANQPFAFLQDNVQSNRLEGYAAFGQTTYSFTDTLRGTLGARWSSTQRTAFGLSPQAIGGLPYDFDKTYDHIDWKVGIEKDLAPKVMIYGAIQTGYQAGTYNEVPNTPTFDNEIQPSKLLAYTAGIKSRWLDDRLQVNAELFNYDYKDLLIQSYDISAPFNAIFNAEKVSVRGVQLDLLARVFTTDQINLNIGYSRARNEDFTTPNGENYDGFQLAYAPDWTGLIGYTRNMQIGEATLRAHIDWSYESSWFGDYVHNRGTKSEATNKGDASLTYDMGSWSAGLWVKNIRNEVRISATAAAGIPGPATSYMDPPRTYGARFQVKY